MLFTISTVLAASAVVSAVPARRGQTVSVTPHEQYSSSVGVLGCKINTNRVAYWPGAVDCNNICVKLTNGANTLNVLKIDSSAGAHDISYDAWNQLVFGQSATADPQQGGGVDMDYEFVPASECASLLSDGKLPLSASNSMDFAAACMADSSSWVGQNFELINLLDPQCKFGWDEKCTLDLSVSNQPSCPHTLGDPHTPTGDSVTNIEYGTGRQYTA
ncbi:hypothetical protein TOPH_07760 [Tolypocladium ophioglossoides CBS 100239]|uniref:Cerato-platanin n=1 Tax=Tolypocladium ophioglossoides (strain CBS 100239) TaxID=1163406 RepID=A0A0L0N0U4_TOLOC|nr:hypothetical protein TOPH_07760 [Tolypocladium ophioglossoides CBS 100239]